MATGRIEQQIDLKVNGLRDVKEAEKLVDSLDGTKAKVTVEADAKKAQRTVADVLADVKKLDGQDATVVLAIRAAAVEQELTDILQTVAKVDAEQATVDVELARAAELRGDLEQLKGAIREIDDTKIDIDIDTKKVAAGLDDVSKSAGSSKSALANMVGNSAQSMGQLVGISGDLGVGIGQIGEYFADASFEGEKLGSVFKNMAAVVGPMAALGVAVTVLNQAMSAGAASKAFDTKKVDQYFDAIQDGTPIVKSFNDEVRETGEVTYRAAHGGGILGLFSSTKDLGPVLERSTVKLSDFNKIVADLQKTTESSADAHDRWRKALEDAGVAEQDAIRIVSAATDEADNRSDAIERQTRLEELFADTKSDTTREFERSERAIDLERDAHLRNNKALYESTLRHADLMTAEERAASEAAHLSRQLDGIRSSLDMEAAVNDFEESFMTAIGKTQGGTALTADEILDLKNDIVNVAEYADLNPIQVQALLDEIDNGNIAGVLSLAQGALNKHKLTAYVELALAKGSFIPGTRTPIADRGGTAGPAGLIAAERRPEFIRLPGGQTGLLTEPSFVPPGTKVTSGAETERILAGRPSTTNVHVHLPRGSRPDDTVAAIKRYARRNGGRRRAG